MAISQIVTNSIAAGAVSTSDIADSAITTAKIADANVTPAKLSQPLTSGTALAYNWNGVTTNTYLDFTSIPSWVKRITVMFSGVSLSGTSSILLQIGSGSVEVTGYSAQSNATVPSASTLGLTSTAGFPILVQNASNAVNGIATIITLGSNVWVYSGTYGIPVNTLVTLAGGSKTISGTLDRIRITTVNGTDTFDAGTVNILYE